MNAFDIVIIDGIDRSGKSTLCSKFAEKYKLLEYDVIELFNENDIFRQICKPFDDFRNSISLSQRYDVIASSQLMPLARMLYILYNKSTSNTAIIINRLCISCIVNMNILRPEQTVWKNDEYIKYCIAFIETIKQFANVYYYNMIFEKTSVPFEDNENPLLKLNHEQLVQLNHEYANIAFHSPLKQYVDTFVLNVVQDNMNVFYEHFDNQIF